MHPGTLIDRDGQAELRGLLLGVGTPYALEDWSGLGLPQVRADDHDLEADDGAAGGTDYYDLRPISGRIGISAADRAELGRHRDRLRRAFARTTGPATTVPFVVRLAGTARLFHVRPRRLELPWASSDSSKSLTLGGAFELVALDPYAYDLDEDAIVLHPDVTTPLDNAGDARSRPFVTIRGPATTPTLTVAETGQALRLDVTLGTGELLEVDAARMRMELNGEPVWVADTGNDWLDLEPGTSTLTYTGGGEGSTAVVAYRNAWQGI